MEATSSIPRKENLVSINVSKDFQIKKYTLVALGLILIIGSMAAAGLSYRHIGSYAFAIGGAGVVLGILCLLGASCSRKRESKEKVAIEKKPIKPAFSNEERARVFLETQKAYEEGYEYQGTLVKINSEEMLKKTETFQNPPPLNGKGEYLTQFSVKSDDTLNVLINLKKQRKNPVGINMANAYVPGGGVLTGCTAQEEAICRRSNHYEGLKTQTYPLPDHGGIYCPHVQVFREDEAHGYAFMKEPQEIALVAVAGYDLRNSSSDCTKLGLLPGANLRENRIYQDGTKAKIRNMLRIMASKGHTHVVLGALGCGAFQNPPKLVAQYFQEVFSEEEFRGRFEGVTFAILKMQEKDQQNIDAFQNICRDLNG